MFMSFNILTNCNSKDFLKKFPYISYQRKKNHFKKANLKQWKKAHKKALENPLKFWEKAAKELFWYKSWKKVFEDKPKPITKETDFACNKQRNGVERNSV